MLFRKAKMSDIPRIQALINLYADQGLMLPRPLNMLYEGLRGFMMAENGDGQIYATGALQVIWEDLAEIRSVAVAPEAVKKGIGRELVNHLLDEARELEVKKVFALTYQPGFFEKCGFALIDKDSLPHKVWKECINCPKFPNCDEIAMIREV